MDVEESIRGNPIDGVVLLCGCDKTTPALVMGAASCDLPALVVSGGPMLNGKYPRPADLGSGTDVWRFSEEVKRRHDDAEGVHAGRVLHVALDRHLQRHGHGVDDGDRWSRRLGWRCRTTRRFRRSTRAATRRRTWPAGGSWSWSRRTSGCRRSSRARRSRTRSA